MAPVSISWVVLIFRKYCCEVSSVHAGNKTSDIDLAVLSCGKIRRITNGGMRRIIDGYKPRWEEFSISRYGDASFMTNHLHSKDHKIK